MKVITLINQLFKQHQRENNISDKRMENIKKIVLEKALKSLSKKLVLIIPLLLFTVSCSASNAPTPKISMIKIAMLESSGDPTAYNRHTMAVGMFQITPICVEDYNQFHKKKYEHYEMFNPIKAYKVADWYINKRIPQLLRHYNKPVTTENILAAYNNGASRVGKILRKETKNYIKKYKRS